MIVLQCLWMGLILGVIWWLIYRWDSRVVPWLHSRGIRRVRREPARSCRSAPAEPVVVHPPDDRPYPWRPWS